MGNEYSHYIVVLRTLERNSGKDIEHLAKAILNSQGFNVPEAELLDDAPNYNTLKDILDQLKDTCVTCNNDGHYSLKTSPKAYHPDDGINNYIKMNFRPVKKEYLLQKKDSPKEEYLFFLQAA